MYSWRERADFTVFDEPFYAFNMTLDTRGHPGPDEVIASQSTDPTDVIDNVIFGEYPTPHVYVKPWAGRPGGRGLQGKRSLSGTRHTNRAKPPVGARPQS